MDKSKFATGVRMGGSGGLDMQALRDAAKSDPALFVHRIQKLVDDGKLKLADLRDLKSLYQALAPVEVPISVDVMGMKRAITTSAFPVLVGSTVVAAVVEAYEAIPTVGQELVTEMDDKAKITTIARIANINTDDQGQVKEGEDYPEIGVAEDAVEITERPNGRLLRITAETIERNQIGDILRRVNALGAISSEMIEEQTLKRVIDLNGSAATPAAPYAYRPSGSGTSLFSATANTPGTRAPSGTRVASNALADETDISNAKAVLDAMLNDNGKPINYDPNACILLCQRKQLEKAWSVKNTSLIPSTTASNMVNIWGPNGMWAGWRPIASGYLDLWAPNSKTEYHWYFGIPKKQFVRKWALRIELVSLGESTESYLRARIAFQARVAWNVEVGATDYVWWIQNLSSTNPPA